MTEYKRKTQYTVLIILCLLISSRPVPGQQVNLLNNQTQPGVVDLTVVTALHPLMSLYDFNRMGFINVEFGLDAKTTHERRQQLKQLDETEKNNLEKELERTDKTYSALKQQQFILLGESRQQQSEHQQRELGEKTASLNQQISEIWQRRNIIRFRLANPDLMEPESTMKTLERIEKEVLKAVELEAEEAGLNVVLNASMPNHNKRSMQREFEVLTEKNLSLAETDLYYAFLTNSKENQEQLKDNEHRGNSQPQSAVVEGAERWLKQSRQPGVQEQLPISPHPLVLKGGIDITEKVVARLLKQYGCNEQVIKNLGILLQKRSRYQ